MYNIGICCFQCSSLYVLHIWVLFSVGKTGVAVMLYDPRRSNFSRIERESGVKFEHLAAPQPTDIATAAGLEAVEAINEISDRYICVCVCVCVPSKQSFFSYSFTTKKLTQQDLQCNSGLQVCCGGVIEYIWSVTSRTSGKGTCQNHREFCSFCYLQSNNIKL